MSEAFAVVVAVNVAVEKTKLISEGFAVFVVVVVLAKPKSQRNNKNGKKPFPSTQGVATFEAKKNPTRSAQKNLQQRSHATTSSTLRRATRNGLSRRGSRFKRCPPLLLSRTHARKHTRTLSHQNNTHDVRERACECAYERRTGEFNFSVCQIVGKVSSC